MSDAASDPPTVEQLAASTGWSCDAWEQARHTLGARWGELLPRVEDAASVGRHPAAAAADIVSAMRSRGPGDRL